MARILSRNHPEIHEGWLCDKGRFAYDYLRAADRIRTPLVRVRRRGFEGTTFEAALDAAEAGLREAGIVGRRRLLGRRDVEQATALARLVREGLGVRHGRSSRTTGSGASPPSARRSPRSRTPTSASCSVTTR